MTLPKEKHRFLTNIAELAQDIMNHDVQVVMSVDGAPSRYRLGLSGRILNTLYQKRLEGLVEAMRATPLGNAIMDYLDAQRVCIDFNHRISARGAVGLDNVIHLSSSPSNAELLGIIAHEARHVWQFDQMRSELKSILPPEVHIASNIYMEADAFSFQQKFLEDYSHHTGNNKGLNKFLREQRHRAAPLGIDDGARYEHFTSIIRNSEAYTDQSIRRIKSDYDRMQKAPEQCFAPSRIEANAIMLDMAQKISLSWPYKNANGGYDSYLAGRSAEEILELGSPSAMALRKMNVYCWHYDQMTGTVGTHTPTLGIKKAPM